MMALTLGDVRGDPVRAVVGPPFRLGAQVLYTAFNSNGRRVTEEKITANDGAIILD